MIKINMNEVARLKSILDQVNSLDLMWLVFEKDGEDLEVSIDDRKEWQFTGMNNVDFIVSRMKSCSFVNCSVGSLSDDLEQQEYNPKQEQNQ